MYLDLTNKQILILDFIKSQVKEKGYPPTVRDICAEVGLKSTSTVHSHLETLEKRGYIKRYTDRPRCITVCDDLHDDNVQGLNKEIIHLPLVRSVRIKHILSKANVERYIPFPANFIKGNNNFILKATDNSMRNLGILEDDYLIVDKKSYARNNQIVLAMLITEKDFVIRRLVKKEDDLIELRAENNLIETIMLKNNEIKIIGVVTGVFRSIK